MKLKLARCFCNAKPKLWRSKSSFSISCPCRFPCRGFSSVSWEYVANAWNGGSGVGFFPREEYDTQTLDTCIDGFSVQTTMETPKMSAVKIEHVKGDSLRIEKLQFGTMFYLIGMSDLFQAIHKGDWDASFCHAIEVQNGCYKKFTFGTLVRAVRVKIIVEGFES